MMKNPIIKNVTSSLLYQVVVLIYGLLVPKLIIEHYGSNVNGLVASITNFLAYIVLLEAGIGPIIKNLLFKPIIEKNSIIIEKILGASNHWFKRIAYFLILYIIVLCIFLPYVIKGYFSNVYIILLIVIISISTFSEYFIGMVYTIFLKANQKDYIIDFINIIAYILIIILIPILISFNLNIHVVKLVSACIFVIKPLVLKFYYNKMYKYKINSKSDYSIPNKFDGFSHHIASVVQKNTDSVVLTVFSSLTNVSIYNAYSMIINGVRSIIVSLSNGIDAYFGKEIIINPNDVNRKFKLYSIAFNTLTAIILSSTLILIIPFIQVYTANITDANYIQPIFAYVLVFAEFLFVIRYPYSSLVYANGDFKQTRNFSIAEPIVNIIVSVVFVVKYGLVGVAIGTLISMGIRSFGFMIYSCKHILHTNFLSEFKLIFISFCELLICLLLIQNFSIIVSNYFEWFITGVFVFVICFITIIFINYIFYRKYINEIIKIFIRRNK